MRLVPVVEQKGLNSHSSALLFHRRIASLHTRLTRARASHRARIPPVKRVNASALLRRDECDSPAEAGPGVWLQPAV